MHRRFSRRHSKTNSTSATQGVNVDGDIAQCSRRQSWSGVFTQWRDKTTRHTRKVLPNVSSPTSPQTSLTSMATTLPTSNSSNLSITPVPTSEHDTYMMQHQRHHDDLGARQHHVKPLVALTINLRDTYSRRNSAFRYDPALNPKRVLTKPSVGCKNNNYDNENSDYIIYVNDVLSDVNGKGQRYVVKEMLGSGTFGQVVKCRVIETGELVSVKIIKNKPAYLKQSLIEVDILKHLNNRWDRNDEHHILRLQDTFTHKNHLCLVFELLSVSLYDLIKQNKFRGLSTHLIRLFAGQILDVLEILRLADVIHCDLKPENILLETLEAPDIKVIDFGSACHRSQRMYTYIQSRFYRSPEVLIGMKYSTEIDMWSFGCIVAELFLGLPIFPGSSEYNQLSRIIDTLGMPPDRMIEQGRHSDRFFDHVTDDDMNPCYRLKSMKKYMMDQHKKEKPNKKYFATTDLSELILSYPMPRKTMTQSEKDEEMRLRLLLVDFLQKILRIDPLERLTPLEAKYHPFITGEDDNGDPTTSSSVESTFSEHLLHRTVTDASKNTTSTVSDKDLANCCICSVGSATIDQQQPPPLQDAQASKGNKFRTAPRKKKGSIATPPLSPDGLENQDMVVSGLSTATNITQSNNSDSIMQPMIPIVSSKIPNDRSKCQLRRRQQTTQL